MKKVVIDNHNAYIFYVGEKQVTITVSAIDTIMSDYNKAVARRKNSNIPTDSARKALNKEYNELLCGVDIVDFANAYTAELYYDTCMEKVYKAIESYVKDNNSYPDTNKLSIMVADVGLSYDRDIDYISNYIDNGYTPISNKTTDSKPIANKSIFDKIDTVTIAENPTSDDDKASASANASDRNKEYDNVLESLRDMRKRLEAEKVTTIYSVNNGLNVYDKHCKVLTNHVALYFQQKSMRDILHIRWSKIDKHFKEEIANWESAIDIAESNKDSEALANARKHCYENKAKYNSLIERKKSIEKTINRVFAYNRGDRAFNSSIKAGESSVKALVEMFACYGIALNPNGKFAKRIGEEIGKRKNNRDKTTFYCDSVMRVINKQALEEFYYTFNEILLKAGISRKCGIPSDIMIYLESRKNKDKEYSYKDVPLSFDDISPIFEAIDNEIADIDNKIRYYESKVEK